VITDVPGLRVGHWTHPEAATGCTVVLFPEGTVASGEVRGGAPASRETALLDPTRTIDRIDALVLTGGSAFGLAAADGVMRFCEERGMGVPTTAGPVPIVVALALFDLAVGDPTVRPGPDQGYAACEAATAGPVELGQVGAGTGATVGTGTPDDRRPGGLVSATARSGEVTVGALVAVNSFGIPAGEDDLAPDLAATIHQLPAGWRSTADAPGNTVIGLVATNAGLDKVQCHLLAQSAHDGLARAVFPAHTRLDGDAFVAAAVGDADADVDAVRILSVHAVATAVRMLADPNR
jgi:L-aminopeptidase/D-esterase-like protein